MCRKWVGNYSKCASYRGFSTFGVPQETNSKVPPTASLFVSSDFS